MNKIFLLTAFLFAAVDWWAVYNNRRAIEKYAKPLTMIMLIFWVAVEAGGAQIIGDSRIIWLLIGLSLCLIGDVFLFLPREKWFVKGLAAFLLGHVGYIVNFGVFQINTSRTLPAFALGVTIGIVSIFIVRQIILALLRSRNGRMVGPIILYSVVISFMLYSAAYKFLDFDWSTGAAFLLAGGALLFYISDILNAWERFVSKFKYDRLIIMVTYHLGQFGIAAGLVIHLTNLIPN